MISGIYNNFAETIVEFWFLCYNESEKNLLARFLKDRKAKEATFLYNLLSNAAVSLDIAFFVIILLGLLFGVIRGFIKSVCKWAGTIIAIFVAFTFCNAFQGALNEWFGLTGALVNVLNNEKLAGWIALAISFVILLAGAKLLAWLLGKIGTALVNKVKAFNVINKLFGGLFGLFEALVLIFFLLMICKWISLEVVDNFIAQSSIVGKIYEWEWFEKATTLPWQWLGFQN